MAHAVHTGPVRGPNPNRQWRVDQPTMQSYMRDVPEVEAQMRELAARHPQLARVEDIGDSARKVRGDGGFDINALVLGTHPNDPSVPRVLFTAGVHPRETANPAALMEWATRTLEAAAAGDPARRALLEERTIVLVPIVNPDAHATVMHGLTTGNDAEIWHRTNHRAGGGVDLNRNFDNRWGAGSTRAGSATYRGPNPASEPEVLAIQQLAKRLQPAGVYDFHSAGGLVLSPVGSEDSRRAAELVARASGYRMSHSDEAWSKPVGGGTVKDWAHDQLGAASLTVETGAVHHQSDEQYADTLARLLPSFDALAATVNGSYAPPAAARALAEPTPAAPFVRSEHLQGVVMEPWKDLPDPNA